MEHLISSTFTKTLSAHQQRQSSAKSSFEVLYCTVVELHVATNSHYADQQETCSYMWQRTAIMQTNKKHASKKRLKHVWCVCARARVCVCVYERPALLHHLDHYDGYKGGLQNNGSGPT